MADFKKLTVNLSLFSTDQSFKSPNSTSKSPRNFENTELVGLGIVAAMNDVVDARHDESSRAVVLAVTPARSNSNSNPIPIISDEKYGSKFEEETDLMELSVETTVAAACLVSGVFGYREFQTADFLNSCFLCTKNLHGLDIFMYRGEKAFCSAECRSQQMASDDKCGSKTKKCIGYSVSPCSGPMMFAVAAA